MQMRASLAERSAADREALAMKLEAELKEDMSEQREKAKAAEVILGGGGRKIPQLNMEMVTPPF